MTEARREKARAKCDLLSLPASLVVAAFMVGRRRTRELKIVQSMRCKIKGPAFAQRAQFLVSIGPRLPLPETTVSLAPPCRRHRLRPPSRHGSCEVRRGGCLSVTQGSSPPTGVVIEREERTLTPLAYPFLAAVLLLPYFSPSHTTSASASSSSASPFDVGTTPFLRFRLVEGIQSVFGEDEFARCGLGREQMASRLAAFAAATLFLSGVSGVISDKLGPWMACIFYWILQLAVGAMKSFSQLRCAWISNFILALSSSMFSFCFETWIVVEHEKQGQMQDLLFDTFWLITFFELVSLVGSQGVTNLLVEDGDKGFLLLYAFAALLSIIGTLYIKNSIKYQSACICDRELPKVIFCPCPQRLTEGMLNCHQFTPVSLPQNAWKCLLSMVLWSHSSFPE